MLSQTQHNAFVQESLPVQFLDFAVCDLERVNAHLSGFSSIFAFGPPVCLEGVQTLFQWEAAVPALKISMSPPPDFTTCLRLARDGDQAAVDHLMPLVYNELRSLAHRYLRSERVGHTMQPTALVHEAYVRLVQGESGPWEDRCHFFAVAARAIRRILVQHARAKASLKRGDNPLRVDIDPSTLVDDSSDEHLIAMNDVLEQLAEIDPEKARLVELRFFAGLTVDEAADAMEISSRSAARQWNLARAWLSRALRGESE